MHGPASPPVPLPARPRDRRGFRTRREFSDAVAPHLPRLLLEARAILGSDDLAEDAVQETLLRVWARGWLPEEPGPALVYLVVRSSLHQARCHRRRRHHEEVAAAQRGTCCEDDPLRLLEAQDRTRAVRAALACLREEHRAVLERFELRGQSYAAIARELGVPIGTVRSRLGRARTQLGRRMGRNVA